MQLLTIAIPKLEEMQRDGEDGRKKIVDITRYLTIALGLLESVMMVIGFYRQNYLTEKTPLTVIMVVTSPVSYTHLDVYKRQVSSMAKGHRSKIKRERNEVRDTRPSAKLSYARAVSYTHLLCVCGTDR